NGRLSRTLRDTTSHVRKVRHTSASGRDRNRLHVGIESDGGEILGFSLRRKGFKYRPVDRYARALQPFCRRPPPNERGFQDRVRKKGAIHAGGDSGKEVLQRLRLNVPHRNVLKFPQGSQSRELLGGSEIRKQHSVRFDGAHIL